MVNYIVFMASQHLFILLAALCVLATPWCLRTALNVTDAVSTVDFNNDNTLVAVTLPALNRVHIYDTTNYIIQQTYVPPANGPAKAARFSKNGLYLVVGLNSGQIDIIPGKAPFSNTTSFNVYTPRPNVIFDLATSYDGLKLAVCYTNLNGFVVVSSYLSNSTTNSSNGALASPCGGVKFTPGDDVAIIDGGNAYTYTSASTPACKTKVTTGTPYTDISVRNVAAGNAKIVVSGGATGGSNAYFFTNSQTGCNTVTPTNVPFVNNPVSSVTSVCYSGDGSAYALGSSDFKMWVFGDSTNN